MFQKLSFALGVEPNNVVHIPSKLIAAHDLEALASPIGEGVNSTIFDKGKIKACMPDFNCLFEWS